MLFKENRLRKKKDFERVLKNKQSRALAVSFLAVRFLPNNLDVSRIGFVVSKKISNKAVQRNKAKRRLRESVRIMTKSIRPGFDIVVFTRKGILQSDFAEIKKTIETLFKRSGLTTL